MRGDDNSCANTAKSLPKMPRSIWALGFVSMLMDISSEMMHALLPLYMVSVLGASVIAVGFIEASRSQPLKSGASNGPRIAPTVSSA